MATTLQNLESAKLKLSAALDATYTNPKKTYSIDGQSVSHSEYRKSLIEELKELDLLIDREKSRAGTAETDNTEYNAAWRQGMSRSPYLNG